MCVVRKLNLPGVWCDSVAMCVCVCRGKLKLPGKSVTVWSYMGVWRELNNASETLGSHCWDQDMSGTPMYALCCVTCCLVAVKALGRHSVRSLHRHQPWLRAVHWLCHSGAATSCGLLLF